MGLFLLLNFIYLGVVGLSSVLKLVGFLGRVASKLRSSTLIQVARRRSKVFQRFSASLVRVGDVQGVSRRHAVRSKKKPGFWKKVKNS